MLQKDKEQLEISASLPVSSICFLVSGDDLKHVFFWNRYRVGCRLTAKRMGVDQAMTSRVLQETMEC